VAAILMCGYDNLKALNPAVIFCGDFNSYPESGLHIFLTQKEVSEENADWYAGMTSRSLFVTWQCAFFVQKCYIRIHLFSLYISFLEWSDFA